MTQSDSSPVQRRTEPLKGGPHKHGRVFPFTEKFFEEKIESALRLRGLFCFRPFERVYIAIPNIYVAGGNWIKLFSFHTAGTMKVRPLDQMPAPMIQVLDSFAIQDDVWFVALWQRNDEATRIDIRLWKKFRERAIWDREEIDTLGIAFDTDENFAKYLDAFFGADYVGYSNRAAG